MLDSAEIVGIGSEANRLNVDRSVVRNCAVSSCVKPSRSFRSAPAQKQASLSLARITARVGPPMGGSECRVSISCRRSERSCLLIALRALGRLRDRILMLPLCGAGTEVIFRVEGEGEGVL